MYKYNFIFGLLISINSYGQKIPEAESTHRVTIIQNDTVYIFYTLKPDKEFKVEKGRFYSWYINDTILETKEGYSGKLLNGNFQAFYPDKNLLEQGRFEKGLKSGLWKTWHPGGMLKEELNWKKGKREGSFKKYDYYGNVIMNGKYRNDVLDGIVIEKQGDSVTNRIKYKSGRAVKRKSSKPKEKSTATQNE